MSTFKTSLLAATMIAGMAVSSVAVAATGSDPFLPLSTKLKDQKIVNVDQGATPGDLSLANNPFAIEAPGNPTTFVAGTTSPVSVDTDFYGTPVYPARTLATDYTLFDGDYSVHGVGATSVQNVLVRAMNCFGTPQVRGDGQAVLGGGPAGGKIGTQVAANYIGTPALTCNNGTWVTQATATAAPTNGILYGYAANDKSKVIYFVPGTAVNSAELQPQFSDYSISTGNIAPYGFSGKYIGSGSGFGQQAWAWATDVFDDGFGSAATNYSKNVPNPFVSVVGQNPWSHVQFAISDSPVSSSNLTTYNANAALKAGPAVQFPLFVTPVAIVYNTVYAKAGTKLLTFNAKGKGTYPAPTGSVASLQLTGSLYCAIFNGMITNWNDAALTQQNKNVPLYDPINDTATRWNSQGAPIRLVARMDNSGTTDIFTRHLAQVCSQSKIYGDTAGTAANSNYFTTTGVTSPLLPVADKKNFVPNKFHIHAQTMPFSAASGVDYTTIRSDTNIKVPAASASSYAGGAGNTTTNTISGDYWTGSAIANIGGATPITPSTPTNYNGSGLFMVANGGGSVAALINYAPDYQVGSQTLGGSPLLFNGKIGYLATDNVIGTDAVGTPATGFLRAAVLSTLPNSYTAVGGIYAYTFYAPTLKNANLAFNDASGVLAFLPPESDSTGAYAVANNTVTSTSGGLIKRNNPFAWTDQFFQNGASYGTGLLAGTYTLAQPYAGYPIVGTTQMLTYTCFSSKGNREAIADLVATLTSSLTVDSTNSKINKNAFTSQSAALPGIIGQSAVGSLPLAWQVAIANTFLKGTGDVNDSTTGAYAAKPLNFTSGIVPTKVKVAAGVFTYLPTTPNASCAEGGNGFGSLAGL